MVREIEDFISDDPTTNTIGFAPIVLFDLSTEDTGEGARWSLFLTGADSRDFDEFFNKAEEEDRLLVFNYFA